MGLLLALTLTLSIPAAWSPERAIAGAFRSDAEAVNFSAHAFASVAIPLACGYTFGRRGLWSCAVGWVGYSLLNEFALHGPESARERTMNLISRLGPALLIVAIDAARH
jgi:hypothetical protein